MTIFLALYIGTGFGLAIMALSVRDFRQCIDLVAARMDMTRGYRLLVWFGGTIIVWPIGLYVLSTDRSLFIGAGLSACGEQDTPADRRATTEVV
ncbi:MAG: hypothetical protein AAF543_06510 [Pseudomonadota bacterium]